MKTFYVIGLMSGTSLDGLDIAYCVFNRKAGRWTFSIEKASTIKYDKLWLKKLQTAPQLLGMDLLKLNNEYGKYLGEQVKKFKSANHLGKIDFVASHGHTIFHQPSNQFTFQLGHGASIVAACGPSVVCDFRSLDVAMNGQGAPLVPIGDKLLFPDFSHCINLGGFANISFDKRGKRIAFDICPVNIILNMLASQIDKEYDKGGAIAAKGKVDNILLQKLNALSFYKKSPPKSLGREWLEESFLPILEKAKNSVEDKLATVTEHIVIQIASVIEDSSKKGEILITGGGAFNTYLIKKLKEKLPDYSIVIPNSELVKYKEALVFAFLGVLRWGGDVNALSSVTGAKGNNKGGAIYIA
ncbi:MAG TPA: anhydro-N-acetylmuramic acid kinase [Bacteroidia bacterium]|nr:anhydro-N-acetylmuramic acid kinase [Bacteroidia bacterium]